MQPKKFVEILSIIHIVLCAGLILFAFFVYLKNSEFTARMNQQDILIYIVPIVAAAGYFLSQLVFKKQIASISREEKLSVKLGKYQIASLIKYALLEGPGILALMAYFWSGNALYLVTGLALIVYLFVQRPKAERIKKELPLTLEEQKQFDSVK